VSAPLSGSTSTHTEVAPASGAGGSDDVWLAYLDGNHYRATKQQ
jgi:hypothetical protein